MPDDAYILFVDDKPRFVADLRQELENIYEGRFRVELRRALNGAWRLIEVNRPALVILDLYLPIEFDLVPACDGFRSNGFNQGQLLGCHLKTRHIPYLYLTSNLEFYEGARPPNQVFEKDDSEAVLREVDKILSQHAGAEATRYEGGRG